MFIPKAYYLFRRGYYHLLGRSTDLYFTREELGRESEKETDRKESPPPADSILQCQLSQG